MHLRGLARIWQAGSIVSGIAVVILMPVAVAIIALLQGTFGWQNPALYLGDPALGVVVALGGMSLLHLTTQQQSAITNRVLQITLLTAGWALGALAEWLGRWQADQRWRQIGLWRFVQLSYKPSDIYHFALYGPLAAIVALSLIAVVFRAAVQISFATALIAVGAILLVVTWGFLAWKTGEMMKAENAAIVTIPQN